MTSQDDHFIFLYIRLIRKCWIVDGFTFFSHKETEHLKEEQCLFPATRNKQILNLEIKGPCDKIPLDPSLSASFHTKRQTKGWKLGWLPASNGICLVSCYNQTHAGKDCCKWWRVLNCNCEVQNWLLRQIYLDWMTQTANCKPLRQACLESGTAILQLHGPGKIIVGL